MINIMNKKMDITEDPTYVKRIINMDNFMQRNSKTQMKWTSFLKDSSYQTLQEYIDDLNSAICIKIFKFMVNLPQKKISVSLLNPNEHLRKK